MPIDSKVRFDAPEAPFLIDEDGVLIGMISKNGRKIFFPASFPQNAITASTSSDQAGAVQLKYRISRVTTVGTIGDSVKLPKAEAGMSLTVINAGANSMDVFPSSGEVINALSADAALAVAANKSITFDCAVNGTWNSNLTA